MKELNSNTNTKEPPRLLNRIPEGRIRASTDVHERAQVRGFCEPEVSTPGASRGAAYHGPDESAVTGMMKGHCDYNRDARHMQLHATDAST